MFSAVQFSDLVTEPLARFLPVHASLKHIIKQASVPLLDSAIIIEDSFREFEDLNSAASATTPLASVASIEAIEEIISATRQSGFSATFHALINQFSLSMIDLFANEHQSEQVRSWLAQGIQGSYLMTDAGGPSVNNWKTLYHQDQGVLQVNKIWGIESHDQSEGYYLIVARNPKSLLPVNILLDPVRVQQLTRKTIGLPFLDGKLQLGNVSGSVQVSADDIPNQGSLSLMNNALSIARPRFVRSVIAHLEWLATQDRLKLDTQQSATIDYFNELGQRICQHRLLDRNLVDTVLAYKFTANAFLAHLVLESQIPLGSDARDLLAFSKMEGSSYRCFLELYNRRKNRRVPS